MGASASPLVETRELTKIYPRKREAPVVAVNGVNMKIFPEEFLAIVGRSGCGKTTLLNLIGALDRPTSGTVIFGSKNLGNLSSGDLALLRREKMGFIFQTFNLLPSLTAFENIEVALAPTQMSRGERKEKVKTLLESLKLLDKAEHLPLELSAGQQQKVAIARAMARDPPLILADEPTGEMDPMTAEEIAAKLVELNHKHNVTVVVTSHGTFPYKLAKRVLFMTDGKIVSQEQAGY